MTTMPSGRDPGDTGGPSTADAADTDDLGPGSELSGGREERDEQMRRASGVDEGQPDHTELPSGPAQSPSELAGREADADRQASGLGGSQGRGGWSGSGTDDKPAQPTGGDTAPST